MTANPFADLSAAVPADLAEAGKVLKRLEKADPFTYPYSAADAEFDAADTIRSLIALATAQAARIEAYQESNLHADKQLLHAKSAFAASEARVAKLVEALEGVMTLLDAGALYEPQAYATRAAIKEAKQ